MHYKKVLNKLDKKNCIDCIPDICKMVNEKYCVVYPFHYAKLTIIEENIIDIIVDINL